MQYDTKRADTERAAPRGFWSILPREGDHDADEYLRTTRDDALQYVTAVTFGEVRV